MPSVKTFNSQRLLAAAKYLLPVVAVAICVIAWYADVIMERFSYRPGATAIVGSWTFDQAEHLRLVDLAVQTVPEGKAREGYRKSLLAIADPYRDAVYNFKVDGYSVVGPAGTREWPATYEGFPPNSLAIRPEHGKPFAILIEAGAKRIVINLPMVGIPLKREGE